ncbi:MAG: 50S ribosome-binding GTPase [Crocinitomicaceae bacterium]|nr:50S ribosome-binding GTPase [Crocinitomicaceae bacterium]MBK8925562.1 50S ribosome-binding GTPase [Crocinitomicaceae bacterium]
MEILRLSTAGSVDDGKSTLIGRLLFDTQSLSKDKLENIRSISAQRGLAEMDLSLITDGLTAEREQGITIDVAHIYFATEKRKYIIADTPGHVEYTRNMITGSSNSQVFVILIDARQGIIEQTKRHLFVAALMEIKEIVIVVNKIDLVNFDQTVYEKIKSEIESLKTEFNLLNKNLTFIPISAKLGDNVVNKSTNTPWFTGVTLLEYLESVQVETELDVPARFNVQYVIRPQSDEFHDYRGYAGKLKSGSLSVGDELVVLSSGQSAKIKRIHKFTRDLKTVSAGESITIELERDIDISRGDVLTKSAEKFDGYKNISSKLCWLDKDELVVNKKYLLQYGAAVVPVKVSAVESQLDFNSLQFEASPEHVGANSINQVEIKAASPLFLDGYKSNHNNGYFILIDEGTNGTVAVGFKE